MDFASEISLLFIISCIYYTVAGILVFYVDKKSKARRRYLLTKLCLAIWALSYAMMTIAPNDQSASLYYSIGFLAFCTFLPSWADFMYHFTEYQSRIFKYLIKFVYMLAFSVAVTHIYFSHITFVKTNLGYQYIYINEFTITYEMFFVLFIASLILFLHYRWVRVSKLRWQKRQAIILTVLTLVASPVAMYTDLFSPLFTDTSIIPAASIILLFLTIPLNTVMRKTRVLNITASDIAEDIFSSVYQPIMALDSNNTVSLANKAATGLWPDDISGKNIAELIRIDDRQPEQSFFTDDFCHEDGVTVKTDGETRYCSALLSVIKDSNGNVLSKILILNDITDLKDALNRAYEAGRARTEFLAKISHEIRTPLNAIIGLTDLAIREDSLTAAKEHLYTVKQANLSLLALINDILDFSKIEADKMDIIPDDYSLSALLNDVVSLIRTRIVDTPLRFTVEVDSNIPGTLYGDEARIRQALLNLLSNAVKYTDNGYVALKIGGYYTDDDMFELVINVTDTGRGIRAGDISKLKNFADFTQFDIEKNKGIEGVGLGLAITNSLVKLMGGSVDVHSQYGEGSTFTINLPQRICSGVKLAEVINPGGKKVIIYEHHVICTRSAAWTLDNLGVEYAIANSDDDMLSLLDSSQYSHLFIAFDLFSKNETEIRKKSGKTELVLLTALGNVSASKGILTAVTPIYCTNIADLLNGVAGRHAVDYAIKDVTTFTAPDAKILVVDDIATNRKVTEGVLKQYGVQVNLCSGGLPAVEAVKRSYTDNPDDRYDLIFMDHKMPDIDGIEATQMIRKFGDELAGKTDNYYKNIPIIALTANVVEGMNEIFIENSFNGVLSKPIDNLALNAVMEKWIPEDKKVQNN